MNQSQKLSAALGDKLHSKVPSSVKAKIPGRVAERVDRSPVVAVVKLHGPITATPPPVSRTTISAQASESALTRAFGHDRLAGVVLSINSPGGAATQSALVADRVRDLAAEKNAPVVSYCEDVAASGGYWLACAGDEIYAHPTSMVGSVGVVSAGFGLHGLLDRIGVERRVHSAGDHKMRLDPFREEKDDDVRWLQGMQAQLHEQFTDWVRGRRGDKLAESDEDLFSGEVWTGVRARELGLVDQLGSLRELVRKRFPDAHVLPVEPRKPLLARLGVNAPAARGSDATDSMLSVVDALEHRALWARFGL